MGYTHYWKQVGENPDDSQWEAICAEAQRVIDSANHPIAGWDGDGEPEINDSYISLNGCGEDSHETFRLHRVDADFEFCKTARKPYDATVVAILRAAKRFAPGWLNLSSDGGDEVFGGC